MKTNQYKLGTVILWTLCFGKLSIKRGVYTIFTRGFQIDDCLSILEWSQFCEFQVPKGSMLVVDLWGQLRVNWGFCSKISSRKMFFWFDFHWLSNGMSKIGHNLWKQSVSKIKIIKKCFPKLYIRDWDDFWHWKLSYMTDLGTFWQPVWKSVTYKYKSGIQYCRFDTP